MVGGNSAAPALDLIKISGAEAQRAADCARCVPVRTGDRSNLWVLTGTLLLLRRSASRQVTDKDWM
jgi:hypothetical protein